MIFTADLNASLKAKVKRDTLLTNHLVHTKAIAADGELGKFKTVLLAEPSETSACDTVTDNKY